jgi:hypothetical protein
MMILILFEFIAFKFLVVLSNLHVSLHGRIMRKKLNIVIFLYISISLKLLIPLNILFGLFPLPHLSILITKINSFLLIQILPLYLIGLMILTNMINSNKSWFFLMIFWFLTIC